MRSLFLLTIIALFLSCKPEHRLSAPVEIKANAIEGHVTADFRSFFDSAKVIALESSEISRIGSIGRITFYRKNIYILDRTTSSIFIYGWDGKFNSKIEPSGKGKGGYLLLQDFTIDKGKGRIVAHSHRPYKVLSYDLNGRFLNEKKLTRFYYNIAYAGGKYLTANVDPKSGNLAGITDEGFSEVGEFLEKEQKDRLFETFKAVYPNLLSSDAPYLCFPQRNMIYTYNQKGFVDNAFKITFTNKSMPDSLFNNNLTAKGIYGLAKENGYGFFISNFRSRKNYAVFTYGKNNIVVYNKRTKKSTTFNYVVNGDELINFENCFGHDGDDDYLVSVKEALSFKAQMAAYRENPSSWHKVADYIKKIDEGLERSSNPLLIVYKFRSDF